MKKYMAIMLSLVLLFCFASCSNEEGAKTDKESITTAFQGQSETEGKSNDSKTEKNSDKTEKDSAVSSSREPTVYDENDIPIAKNDALRILQSFYGGAYSVKEGIVDGDIQIFEVYDKKDNLYAKVEVNLKNSDAKETIMHSGEINEINLLI